MGRCYCIISMFLIISFSAEGRSVFKHAPAAKQEESAGMVSSKIGSRPPRCERRCISCGHCEAIQVPVVRQQLARPFSHPINSRADEYKSNYKPMHWKCKCGNRILNP